MTVGIRIAGNLAHCAAIVTFVVALAARPVSADPPRSPPLAHSSMERSHLDCGTYRVGFPNGSFDPLVAGSNLRSPLGHRAVVGIPQTAPGGLAHPVVKRFVAQHADELARCYPRRLPATTNVAPRAGSATAASKSVAPLGPGQIGLSVVILPNGSVQLLGALGFDAEVTSCMAKVIESIEFPRSRRGDVTHTFVPITIVEDKR